VSTPEEMRLAERIADQAIRDQAANARFAKASAREKRLTIAHDVLAWLRVQKIKPMHGYLVLPWRATGERSDKVEDDGCHACALGAVFACAVDRMAMPLSGGLDKSEDEPYYDANEMRNTLKPYFSNGQLRLIETAYEKQDFSGGEDQAFVNNEWGTFTEVTRSNVWGRAVDFGRRYPSDRGRMRAIMRNIIANNGTFKP
jgi:hypothetical protein